MLCPVGQTLTWHADLTAERLFRAAGNSQSGCRECVYKLIGVCYGIDSKVFNLCG